MGTARYTFRAIGPVSDAAMTALQEGLKGEVGRASTAVQGWRPATHRGQPPSRRVSAP